jgi:hypothetical protein
MNAPFLTDLDSRAAIKGSREPLGLQSIWTRLGRQVVSNLTTVTRSVRDFTAHLIGFHLIERLRDEGGALGSELEIFLRWEQLAAYSRAIGNDDFGFRGTERVRSRLQGGERLVLSAETAHQILSNQKIYGLWGLFTNASRDSGLVEVDPLRLAPAGRRVLEEAIVPALARGGLRDVGFLVELVARDRVVLDHEGKHQRLIKAVATALSPQLTKAETALYRETLAWGGPQNPLGSLQRSFVDVLDDVDLDRAMRLNPRLVDACARAARRQKHTVLAERLEQIGTAEAVFAPCVHLFAFLLARQNQSITDVVASVHKAWGKRVPGIDVEGFRALRGDVVQATSLEMADRLEGIGVALDAGDYEGLVRRLIEQNAAVMRDRGGASPWIALENDRLRIRFRDEVDALPSKEALPQLWSSPYFIDSLRAIAAELREGQR